MLELYPKFVNNFNRSHALLWDTLRCYPKVAEFVKVGSIFVFFRLPVILGTFHLFQHNLVFQSSNCLQKAEKASVCQRQDLESFMILPIQVMSFSPQSLNPFV